MKHMVFLVVGAMMMFVSQSRAQSSIPTAGLQLWLKADAGVDTLNGTVNRWHDQSGNGNDAIQANASRQPLLVAGALNGKPVLRFDGLNDKLGFTGTTHMTQFSLFVVINNHTGSDGDVITFGANGDFNHQWFMGMPYPTGSDSIGMAGGDGSGWVRGSKPGLAAHDAWRNLSVVLNQTIWNTTLRWDGNDVPLVPGGSTSAISVPLGDATGSGGGIGGADGVPNGTLLAKCDVAEVIVYNVALSDPVRQDIVRYLATKYGLPQPPIPTGLRLWLRADAGVDTLNGTVSRWHDQSGNGNDAIQADASRRPLVVGSALNGKPVLRFDGLNDKLGFTGTTQMTQFSLFLVINNHTGSDGDVLTFGPPGGDFSHLWFMGIPYPSGSDSIGMAGGDGSGWVRGSKPGLAAHDAWRNLSVVANQTIWNTSLRWDGNEVPMVPGGSASTLSIPLGDSTGAGGGIGGADGVPVGRLKAKCDVAEVIVYDVPLSDPVRQDIIGYLATKYGLQLPTSVVEHQTGNLPKSFALEQNYPNPFNPSTTIRFSVPERVRATLKIFDLLGREVSTLVNGELEAGQHQAIFDGTKLSSGVYFYRLQAGSFESTKKLLLVK